RRPRSRNCSKTTTEPWARQRPPPCWLIDPLAAAMTDSFEASALLPALPEIVLVIGAMVLLMAGVFRAERASRGVDVAAILLLVATGVIVALLPAGKLVTFGGSFVIDSFARFLKLLALAGSATSILMSFNYLAVEKQQRFEYSILILLSTTG